MLLKKLELQGYKTFASRSEFVFESGITAIVGPNGSGKSNIADAIRWVLGEQSYRLLRGKRTEDMIFAGSQKRARAGMAQATITLDNSDGQLPLDFSEVAISRRAYRSGENEYLLNGRRVRLRDITELLSASGLGQRSYNVIGQGLIDAALALRAEERRALFEEAAGISLYKDRRADALGRLDETQRNLERIEDILNEISPRMRRLERQAERSQEYHQVHTDLHNLLYLWYGYHWELAKNQLRKARQEAGDRFAVLEAVLAKQNSIEESISGLRQEASHARSQLGDLHHQYSHLHQNAEKVQRNLAVHIERLRLLGKQREDLVTDLGPLQRHLHQVVEQLAQATQELDQADSRWQEQQAAVQQAQEAFTSRRRRIAQLSDQEQQLQTELVRIESEIKTLDEQRSELLQEQSTQATLRETIQETLEQLSIEQAEAQSHLTSLQAKSDEIQNRLSQVAEQRRLLLSERQVAQADLRKKQGVSQEALSYLSGLKAQYQALADLRTTGAGHQQALQQLLALPNRSEGIIGPMAQLLEVPAELEQAVAAVLGNELSALVVADWAAARQILALITRNRIQGRLSVFPLDELRSPQSIEESLLSQSAGVLGVASALVNHHPSHKPLLDCLLGQVVIVRDQEAARQLAPALPPGGLAVTLEGLIVSQNGRITLPGSETSPGLLSQERSWRILPRQIDAASSQLNAAQVSASEGQARLEKLDSDLERLDLFAHRLQDIRQATSQDRETIALQLDRAKQNIAWHQENLQETDWRSASQSEELSALGQKKEDLIAKQDGLRSQLHQAQAHIAQFPLADLQTDLSMRERALAQTEGARRNQKAMVDTLQSSRRRLEEQLTDRQQRIQAITTERTQLSEQISQERHAERNLAEQIQKASEFISPLETRLAEIENRLDQIISAEEQLKRQVRGAEQAANQSQLNLDRRENALENLRDRIQDDLGLVHLPLEEDIDGQTPLPLGELVGQLPVVQELDSDLENAIRRRKQQLRRMEPVNPNAPAEYAELQERHRFLTDQVRDLREADAKLRQIIAELNAVMEQEFVNTFEQVAAQFKGSFTRLFGGGSARLVLTNPEDPIESGVEIIARPPDRRQQGLALLSGGERSLTAAALIFALLSVSPTPFCVLDEVDAALDEANIGRFREMLCELGEKTQFIVITHNRGTIQAADTIYGISMKADGASQVISLRIEQDALAELETVGEKQNE